MAEPDAPVGETEAAPGMKLVLDVTDPVSAEEGGAAGAEPVAVGVSV